MNLRYRLSLLLAGATLILGAFPASGDTVTLQPTADTTLMQVVPENNLGGADFFNAGTAGNGNRNRALMRFDVAGAIPPGSAILGASLALDVVRQPVMDLQTSVFSLRRLLVSWGEGAQVPADPASPGLGSPAGAGEANWMYRFAFDVPWSVPGGQPGVDFSQRPSSLGFVCCVGDPVFFESTADTAADVQHWLDNPGENFGWMLLTESEQIRKTARSFASRESGFGPTLTIEFTPVPEPASLLLLAVGAVGLITLVCRR